LNSAADNIADGLIEGKSTLRKYGAILQRQSRSMSRLVDEILLFASTEDGTQRYVLQPLQLTPIIDSIVKETEGIVRDSKFVLDYKIESDLPFVLGDVSGISKCLQNLISNAIKYGGEDRRIVLHTFQAGREQRAGREVCVSITDRGIGIDSSELAHIFDPFYRSPRVSAAQIHGTGLGLSLAKRLAESMGGRISVLSEISVGSTFTLHLQVAKGEDKKAVTSSFPSSLSQHK
jgi:signal transduction histidine kinase